MSDSLYYSDNIDRLSTDFNVIDIKQVNSDKVEVTFSNGEKYVISILYNGHSQKFHLNTRNSDQSYLEDLAVKVMEIIKKTFNEDYRNIETADIDLSNKTIDAFDGIESVGVRITEGSAVVAVDNLKHRVNSWQTTVRNVDHSALFKPTHVGFEPSGDKERKARTPEPQAHSEDLISDGYDFINADEDSEEIAGREDVHSHLPDLSEVDDEQFEQLEGLEGLEAEYIELKAQCLELRAEIGPMAYDRLKIEKELAELEKDLSNVDSSYDKNSIALKKLKGKLEQQLNINKVAPAAIAEANSRSPAEFIAQGKLKKVWRKNGVRWKVYYTARKSSAEDELKSEIQTTLTIQSNLKKSVLKSFLKDLPVDVKNSLGSGKKHILDSLYKNFSSVHELVEDLERGKKKYLSSKTITALRKYAGSKEGQDAIKAANERGLHLSINVRAVEDNEKIEDKYTLETDSADGDLEKLLRNPKWHTQSDQLDIIDQTLKGLADLHAAGFVHGDIKPDNVLVTYKDRKWLAKVADFGKARKIKDLDSDNKYYGNPRFADWGNRLSTKGEVCSAGILLIRMLEQRVLEARRENGSATNPRILIQPTNKGISTAAPKRDGFEVFMIESADFNAVEADYSKSNMMFDLILGEHVFHNYKIAASRIFQGYKMLKNNSDKQNIKIAKDVVRYIDALEVGLNEIGFTNPAGVKKICNLIKRMTDINVNSRPTMAEASAQFEKLKNGIL